jgi:hypothetical protein
MRLVSLLRPWLCVLALACCAWAGRAEAQFFRNQAFIAQGNWQGLGSTWDRITGATLWNIHDQPVLGAGYTFALGYDFWFETTAGVGYSPVVISDEAFEGVLALHLTAGFRYNLMSERFRPFVSVHGQLAQFIPTTPNPPIAFNQVLGGPIFAGGRAGGGIEWFFMDEVSLLLELNMAGFLSFNSAPPPSVGGVGTFILPASTGRIAVLIYF